MAIAEIHNLQLARAALEKVQARAEGLPGLAVIYGPAGWGKTTALTAVANQTRAYYIQLRSAWGRKSFLEHLCVAMGLADGRRVMAGKSVGTIAQMLDQIAEQLALSGRPLIIDEADFLIRTDGMAELLRDIYEASGSAIVLSGEEMMPAKMQRWERLHSRVLGWIPAQPVSLDDARLLAPVYCRIPVADDFLEFLVQNAQGSVRRVCVNLAQAQETAFLEGWERIDRALWGARPIYTGEAPVRGRK